MPGSADTVTGLDLLDVIQLKGVTRFSGCISVQCGIGVGLLFFRDGQIIHAEVGAKAGEEAFYEILRDPGAPFSLQANVSTTSHSVTRSWQFLLMESQRLVDEGRRNAPPSDPAPADHDPAAPPSRRGDLVERIRRLAGVVWAAFAPKDGATAGDDPLAAQAAQLGRLARIVGERLRAGEVMGATVQGTDRNVLLMATKAFHLLIVLQAGPSAATAEAEIRKLLAARR
jgi:predicted regulator of Ras-like GTPase activity (Roadblock/LC7/MglB family)